MAARGSETLIRRYRHRRAVTVSTLVRAMIQGKHVGVELLVTGRSEVASNSLGRRHVVALVAVGIVGA